MMADAMAYAKLWHAKCMQTSCIWLQNISIQPPSLGHLRHRNGYYQTVTPFSCKHLFILIITDYSSTWAEAIPLKEVKIIDMVKFIKYYVIYRFDIPRRIISNKGLNLPVGPTADSVTSSEYKSWFRRHTIQPLMAKQKRSTRPL